MNIGIDIDDTLTYLKDIKIQYAKKYIKNNNLSYKLINADSVFFSEMFDWPIEECDKFWFEESFNMLSSAPARQNASLVLNNLRQNGHKLIIITARSNNWHEDPYKISYDWLVKNNIPFDKLIVGQQNKRQACVEEKIDVFIDDMPNNLIDLQDLGIYTILMNTAHNKNQTTYTGSKVSEWTEVEQQIQNYKKI